MDLLLAKYAYWLWKIDPMSVSLLDNTLTSVIIISIIIDIMITDVLSCK